MDKVTLPTKKFYFDFVSREVLRFIDCSRDVSRFIAAQSCLETGFGSSDIYLNGRNLFGMRFPVKRICTTSEKYKNHCCYSTPYLSLCDYFLWLVANGFKKSDLMDLDKFSVKLRNSAYNPSEKYVDTILTIYKTYTNE